MILRSSPTGSLARSWSEAWQLSRQIAQLTYSDPNTWVDADMTYLHYSRGALAMAAKLGYTTVNENFTWATTQIAWRGWRVPYKWRLGTGI